MFKAIILFITSTVSAWFVSFTNPQQPPVVTPISTENTAFVGEFPQVPMIAIQIPQTPNLTQETPTVTQTPVIQTPQPIYVPIIIPIQPSVGTAPKVIQSSTTTITNQQIMPSTQKLASLKVIQMGGGIQDKFTANDYKLNPNGTLAAGSTEPNDSNFIDLGLIIRNDDGISVKDAEVVITATDTNQNKTIKGTGNIRKIYDENEKPETVSYYPFRYEFRTTGQHVITFKANGMTNEFKADAD